jgi:ABC-2 type transport system permease protein
VLPAASLASLARAAWRRHGVAAAAAAAVTVLGLLLGPWLPVAPLLVVLGLAVGVGAWVCRRRGPAHAVAGFALALTGVGFVLLMEWFFGRVFYNLATLEDLQALGEVALRRELILHLVTLVLSLAFTLLFMSTPGVALSAIYLDAEAAPLLLAPRRDGATFGARFLLAGARVSLMALAVLVPCVLALGQALGAGAAYYVIAPGVLLLLFLPPLAAGCGATALLMRLFPVQRLQQVLTVVTLVALAGIVILVRAAQPERLLAGAPPADLEEVRRLLAMGGLGRLPGGWAAAALMGLADGGGPGVGGGAGVGAALGRLAAAGAAALVVLGVLGASYRRTYARGQERTTALGRRGAPWPAGGLRLLLSKDLRLFGRDAKEWSQVLMLVALVILYLYNISRMPRDLEAFRSAVAFINLAVLGFMLAALNLRFTFAAMALEGPGLWTLLKAPVPRARLLVEKVLFTGLPLACFGLALTALAGRMLRLPAAVLALDLGVTLVFALVLHPLALALGLRQYRPPEADPVRMALSPAGLIYMVAACGYVLVALALAAPAMLVLLGRGHGSWVAGAVGLAALAGLSAALAAGALRAARRRLERLEC